MEWYINFNASVCNQVITKKPPTYRSNIFYYGFIKIKSAKLKVFKRNSNEKLSHHVYHAKSADF